MDLTADDIIPGKEYVLKRDFIQSPQIRHNFGTIVVALKRKSNNREKVMVKIKGSKNGGFMVPISILARKSELINEQ